MFKNRHGQRHYFRPKGETLKGKHLNFLDILGAPGVREAVPLGQILRDRRITVDVLAATGSWRKAKRAVVKARIERAMKNRFPYFFKDDDESAERHVDAPDPGDPALDDVVSYWEC